MGTTALENNILSKQDPLQSLDAQLNHTLEVPNVKIIQQKLLEIQNNVERGRKDHIENGFYPDIIKNDIESSLLLFTWFL